MKKTIITILLALVATTGWAQVPLESVKELTMKSEYFNHERQVLIYTPDSYSKYDQTYYDVIYVFDAQDRTMFDLVHCLLNMACKPDPDGGKNTNFIIVGICSPTLWDINYFRNHDYLPMPLHGNTGLFKEGYYYGKSPDLKKFVKNELMPYVKTHYRTSGRSFGIGHSLSASFVLDAMITDDLFDDYIAISPNCAYDEYRLATDIESYQFKNRKAPRFIYASMSGEIDNGPEYWGNWEAKGVKMTLTSDSVASIDLHLHIPAQFKFTRGSWECEAIISNADTGNLIIHDAEHANRVYRL